VRQTNTIINRIGSPKQEALECIILRKNPTVRLQSRRTMSMRYIRDILDWMDFLQLLAPAFRLRWVMSKSREIIRCRFMASPIARRRGPKNQCRRGPLRNFGRDLCAYDLSARNQSSSPQSPSFSNRPHFHSCVLGDGVKDRKATCCGVSI